MQALVFTAPGEVQLRDEPYPVAGEGETLVTVEASGICGSELHGFRSVGMRRPPLIMGHEFAGTTDGGTRVVVNPLLTCGTCAPCLLGSSQICERRQLMGVHRPGGFAEAVAVPRDALHVLPDDVGWAEAALIEPLANAVHAWGLGERAGGGAQDRGCGTVAIVGAGSIGLVCLLVARHHGSGEVVVADPSPDRRAVASRLGATVVAALDDLDGLVLDSTFDAVGLPLTRAAALAHLRPGGTSVWIGLGSPDVAFDGNDLVRSEKRVLGSFAYSAEEFRAAVELSSQVDLGWGTDVPMTAAESTFMELAQGRTDIIKAVLRRERA